jgi:hypothetical protein
MTNILIIFIATELPCEESLNMSSGTFLKKKKKKTPCFSVCVCVCIHTHTYRPALRQGQVRRGSRSTVKNKILWTKNRKDRRKIYKNKEKWCDKQSIRQ